MAADGLGEAGADGDGVVEHVLGDETAPALLDADQAGAGEFLEGAADGVAIDGEADGELGLGGELRAGGAGAVADFAFEGLGDLAPEGEAALAGRWRCHGNVIRFWGSRRHVRLTLGWAVDICLDV